MGLRRFLRIAPRIAHRAAAEGGGDIGGSEPPADDLQSYLRDAFGDTAATTSIGTDGLSPPPPPPPPSEALVHLRKLPRVPAKFDLLSSSYCYVWETTAKHARKVHGPMHEWADELKYRTGVHVETELTRPDRLASGSYATADEVEVTVYLFGTERAVENCRSIMESALRQNPCYVRLAVYRRTDAGVEWLSLRRINRDLRPPDIPAISLKTPGKYTLLYEGSLEAAVRSLWEETGLSVSKNAVTPTSMRMSTDPNYYWRVPVKYHITELPPEAEVLGPQVNTAMYMQKWDARLLRHSVDPIDRVWAQRADPLTATAWLSSRLMDELQQPLKGEHYMSSRYYPPPHSALQEATGLSPPPAPPEVPVVPS